MKKKFEIIEEGRLSKSDMSNLVGGEHICVPSSLYKVWPNCSGPGSSYSSCPNYKSCNDATYLSCKSYGGPTGPGGSGTSIEHFEATGAITGEIPSTHTTVDGSPDNTIQCP